MAHDTLEATDGGERQAVLKRRYALTEEKHQKKGKKEKRKQSEAEERERRKRAREEEGAL